jgi:hypothetical protein
MFRQKLTDLFDRQRECLERIIGIAKTKAAFDFANAKGFSIEFIDLVCTKELKIVLAKKHDFQSENSNRLGKYGWSNARITDHMLKLFHARMNIVGRILKAFVDSTDPEEALKGYEGPKSSMQVSFASEEFDDIEVSQAYRQDMAFDLDNLKVD